MPQNNYHQLTNNVRSMIDPERIMLEKSIQEDLSSIRYSDVVEYVRFAMNGVDPAYTQKTKDAGENVKTHLTNGGLSDASFRYQGSVMTNTHIKGYSDIDLLTISEKFYQYDFWDVRSLLNDSINNGSMIQAKLKKLDMKTS